MLLRPGLLIAAANDEMRTIPADLSPFVRLGQAATRNAPLSISPPPTLVVAMLSRKTLASMKKCFQHSWAALRSRRGRFTFPSIAPACRARTYEDLLCKLDNMTSPVVWHAHALCCHPFWTNQADVAVQTVLKLRALCYQWRINSPDISVSTNTTWSILTGCGSVQVDVFQYPRLC
jgi:hypothetical protein